MATLIGVPLAAAGMGCGTMGGPPSTLSTSGISSGDMGLENQTNLVDSFIKDFTASHDSPRDSPTDDRDAAVRFTRTGTALVHSKCSDYLNKIGKQIQKQKLIREAASIAATAAGSVMPIVGASRVAISLTEAGFAGFLAGDKVVQDTVLFTPDGGALRSLVVGALGLHRAAVLTTATGSAIGAYGYAEAHRDVLDNQAICEVQGIANLVKQAVERGELEVVSRTARDALTELLNSLEAVAVKTRIGKVFGMHTITNEQLIALHWLHSVGMASDIEGEVMCKTISVLGDICDTNDRPKASYAKQAEVEAALGGLSKAVRDGLDASVDSNRKKIKDAEESNSFAGMTMPSISIDTSSGSPSGGSSVRVK